MTDTKTIEITSFRETSITQEATHKRPKTLRETLEINARLDDKPIILEIENRKEGEGNKEKNTAITSLFEAGFDGCQKVVAEIIKREGKENQRLEVDEIGTLKPVIELSAGRQWIEGQLGRHNFKTTKKSDPTKSFHKTLKLFEKTATY